MVTYLANTLGCVARIYTSIMEGGGMAMVRGYVIGECPWQHVWLSC